MEDFGEKKKKELAEKRRELDRAKQRITEIDGIIQKLYEDNATGRISDERFATMSMSLENEQSRLKDSIPEMESCLENAKIQTEGLQRFIDKAKRVTQLTELTPELVHEFIQKIVVSKPEYRDDKRYQGVEIYDGIVRCLAKELGPSNITVNQIAPGWTISFAAVSYTHLDVYKRQDTGRYYFL